MDGIRIALSFDDGRKDNYSIAKEILSKYQIQATFNITTAYVERTIRPDQTPCNNEALDIKEVVELYDMGFEIAGHGDCHQNSFDDIRRGIEKIRTWIPNESKEIGFASPKSLIKKAQITDLRDKLEDIGVKYIRTGVRHPSGVLGFIDSVERKIASLTKNEWFYTACFKDSLLSEVDNYVLYSVPVMQSATFEQVVHLIRYAIRHKKDMILLFHSILSEGEEYYYDTWSWDVVKFERLCAWLTKAVDDNKCSLVKTIELVR